jgi:hypothetical protein
MHSPPRRVVPRVGLRWLAEQVADADAPDRRVPRREVHGHRLRCVASVEDHDDAVLATLVERRQGCRRVWQRREPELVASRRLSLRKR